MNREQIEGLYPLALAVRRLFHKLSHAVSTLHGDGDVSAGMRAVLESVIEGGPQTVPQMARVRPVSRQHIQVLVNELLEGGYVETLENPAHKRSVLVSPTEHGRTTFAAMRAREAGAFKRLDLDLTPEQMASATAVLRSLGAALDSPAWRAICATQPHKEE